MNLTPYIGIPYVENGRDSAGMDCWGLVMAFYRKEFDIKLPDYRDEYVNSKDRHNVAATIRDNIGQWLKIEFKEIGDLLVFNILGHPIHTAVYLGDGSFLHCFQNTHSCIEMLESITWARRLVGAYRWQKT